MIYLTTNSFKFASHHNVERKIVRCRNIFVSEHVHTGTYTRWVLSCSPSSPGWTMTLYPGGTIRVYVWSLTNPAVCLQCRGRGSLFHLLHVLLYQTDDSYPPCITCTSFRSQCSQNSGCPIKFSSHHLTEYIVSYCLFCFYTSKIVLRFNNPLCS